MVLSRPHHLQVYLSNRCNLACSYCYVAVNQGASKKLDFPQIAKAIDLLIASPAKKRKLVSFLGGEPFLQKPLLLKSIDYIRKTATEPITINVYTNGSHLNPESLDELSRRDVYTILSLDGERSSTDRHRVFANGQGSVFDEVIKRVKDLPKQWLKINMVVSAEAIADLVKNVDYFHRMGFYSINFYPEVYSALSQRQLSALKRELNHFANYYARLFLEDERPFDIPAFSSFLERRATPGNSGWWHSCGNIVLGFDGNFHACDKAMSFPAEHPRGSAVGSPEFGMDWDVRGALYDQARHAINQNKKSDFTFCPMGVYFYSRWSRKPRLPLEMNFRQIDSMYSSAFKTVLARAGQSASFLALYPGTAHDALESFAA